MSTDLSKLTTVAEKWEEMEGSFNKMERAYRRDVHGISTGGSWVGLSAQAANDRFSVTLKELEGAQREAKAVASLLREAYTQLVDLQGKVKAVCADAVKNGMRVSDQGVVAFDTERLTQGERTAYMQDPSYQESGRAKAAEWAQRLEQAVKAVSDADDGLRLALNAAVLDTDFLDGTIGGFNRNPTASPYPSLEAAGKAANIPKDSKAVAEWWADLDPVTRAVLLRERGDELRAAGIMDPQYEWRSPDVGSGPFDVEEPTPRDLGFHAVALSIATSGDVIGQTAASRNMLHYLGGTGDTLDLDVDRMLHDDGALRSDIENSHITPNKESGAKKLSPNSPRPEATNRSSFPSKASRSAERSRRTPTGTTQWARTSRPFPAWSWSGPARTANPWCHSSTRSTCGTATTGTRGSPLRSPEESSSRMPTWDVFTQSASPRSSTCAAAARHTPTT
jgi:hypothetical protein